MKEKILKHIHRSVNMPEFISGIFVLLMLTVQLFVFGPRGYRNITIVKYVSFLAVSGIYIAAMLLWCAVKKRGCSQRLKRKEVSPTEIFVLIYLALTVISALVSEFFPDTVIGANRREGALTIGIYCVVFLMLVHGAWSGKWTVYLLGLSITAFSIVCILQLFRINIFFLFPEGLTYYDAGEKYSGEFLGTLGNAGLTASLLCLSAPIFLVYISRAKEKDRLWLLIPLLLSAAVLIASRIAAGILGFFAGVFISLPFVFARGRTRVGWIIAELLLAALGLAAVYQIDFESGILYEMHSILHGNFDDSFGTSRIFVWRNTLPLIPERPLLGGGPDTLAQRIGVIFETVKDDGTVRQAAIDAAHNEYLNIAVCQGVPALVAYMAALCSTLVRFVKNKTNDPVAAALAVGVVCYCIQAFFGISMFISAPYFWIIWALLESRLRIKEKNDENRKH